MATTQSATVPKPPLAPLLTLLAPLLGLFMYLTVLDSPLIDGGADLTLHNPQVSGLEVGWREIWLAPTPPDQSSLGVYRPVLVSLLRLEWKLWGNSPSSFHSINLLLYLGLIILFLPLVKRLITHPFARTAAVLTLVLHPMATQSVLDVAGQGALVSLLACLGGCYILFVSLSTPLSLTTTALTYGVLTLLAVGSHEMGMLMPVWLLVTGLLCDLSPQKAAAAQSRRSRRVKKNMGVLSTPAPGLYWVLAVFGPVAGIMLFYLLMRHWALGNFFPLDGITRPLDASRPALFQLGPSIFLAYFLRLIWPVRPTLVYSLAYEPELLLPAWMGWTALMLLASAAVAACRAWRSVALALIFLLTVLLALCHWIPLSALMSEDPLVFAIPGFSLLMGALLEHLMLAGWTFPPTVVRNQAIGLILAIALAGMAWQVWQRGREWEDAETLWETEGNRHPNNAVPLINLLKEYVGQNKEDRALSVIHRARMIALPVDLDRITREEAALYAGHKDPKYLKQLIDKELASQDIHEKGHYSKLAAYAITHDLRDAAEALWRKELEHYPAAFEALYELCQIEMEKKNYKEAIELGIEACRHAPAFMRARTLARYGVILAEAGFGKEAAHELTYALEIDRTLDQPYIYLARIFWGRKDYLHAEDALARGFQNANVTSKIDLAKIYCSLLEDQGQTTKALDWLMSVVIKYPRDIKLQLFAAQYQMNHQRYEQAQKIYMPLLNLNGAPLAKVYLGLSRIAWKLNHLEEALNDCRMAIKIDPADEEAKDLYEQLGGRPDQLHPNREPSPTPKQTSSRTIPLEENGGSRLHAGDSRGCLGPSLVREGRFA